jgi:uncharacterized protein (TIGR00251 family)
VAGAAFLERLTTGRLVVTVTPASRKPGISRLSNGEYSVRVPAPPVDGRANGAVVELLASALKLRAGKLRIIRGARSRQKLIEVDGLDQAEIDRRLSEATSAG